MSKVTAIVLTIGEDTTMRAIDSIKKQTLSPDQIIVIKNVTPFHKALNLGVSKVKTDLFIQVDSDMVLDNYCIEALRKCMEENVGIVAGHLRDPLIGRVTSIKMFRKECFQNVQFKNSISPDTDFRSDILKYGWTTVYALSFLDTPKRLWHTFGEHKPVYTQHYTYSKYLLEGNRYRYRKALGGLQWHIGELQNSNHSVSLIALIALSHGIFLENRSDMLKPYAKNKDFVFLKRFLITKGDYSINKLATFSFFIFNHKRVFKKYYKLGIALRKTNSFPSFKHCMDILKESHDVSAWIAKVGLCQGLFIEDYSRKKFKEDYDLLKELISA